MITEDIQEGFELMAVGMGTVFSFLVLLVICMTFIGRAFEKFGHFFPEPGPADSAPAGGEGARPPRAPGPGAVPSAPLAVAIVAAHRHRARGRGD